MFVKLSLSEICSFTKISDKKLVKLQKWSVFKDAKVRQRIQLTHLFLFAPLLLFFKTDAKTFKLKCKFFLFSRFLG